MGTISKKYNSLLIISSQPNYYTNKIFDKNYSFKISILKIIKKIRIKK